MNKNKKLISLICALAMVFSMFSGLTIVNAADKEITKGLTLTLGKVDDDANTVEIVAGFTGIADGFKSGKVGFEVPATATAEIVKEAANGAIVPVANGDKQTIGYSVSMGQGKIDGPTAEIATIKLTFKSQLTEPLKLTLTDDSYMYDAAASKKYYGIKDLQEGDVQIEAAEVTIPQNSKLPTPKPTMDVDPDPIVTEPDVPKPPVLDPIVDIEKGLTLTLGTVDKSANTVEIIAGFKGIADGFKSGKVGFEVPATVTAEIVKEAANGAIVPVVNGDKQTIGYSVSMGQGKIDGPTAEIATIKLKFVSALTEELQLKLTDDSYMYDAAASKKYYGIKDLQEGDVQIKAANVNIPAFGVSGDDKPTENTAATITMNKAIGKVDAITDTPVAGESEYFIKADVKLVNGDAANYGEHYVVKLGDKALTEAQYKNLINGHFNADNVKDLGITSITQLYDATTGLKYVPYNTNKLKVNAPLIKKDNKEVQNAVNGVVPDVTAEPTKDPDKAELKFSVTPSTVYVGSAVTVKANIKNAGEDGVLTAELAEGSGKYITYEGVTFSDENKTAKFTAAAKGTVKINYTYEYTMSNGVEDTATGTATVNIKEKKEEGGSSNGGSSSDNNNGGSGPIAGPGTNVPGTSTGVAFTDIADVSWANEAIIMLANKGIISGRSEGIFAPNDNITRAEYCQILVGAIGKTSDSANSSFDDVATDAWYYHAVSVASNLGIVSGYGDGNFGPNNLITRQDMALMTYKAAQVTNKDLSANRTLSFADAGQISDYAQEAVQTLANASIINGVSDTEFAPQANATRAQAAKILYDTFVKAY